jgi:hypothetical protein
MRHIYPMSLAVVLAAASSSLMAQRIGIPSPTEIADCSADSIHGGLDYWRDFRVSCEQFEHELLGARVVSEFNWLHEYSHVSGGDRSGLITLRDGVNVRWMVRPGGLGLLEWPDGSKLHLVFCQCNGRSPSSSPSGPNPSIERTPSGRLRPPTVASHVERYAASF